MAKHPFIRHTRTSHGHPPTSAAPRRHAEDSGVTDQTIGRGFVSLIHDRDAAGAEGADGGSDHMKYTSITASKGNGIIKHNHNNNYHQHHLHHQHDDSAAPVDPYHQHYTTMVSRNRHHHPLHNQRGRPYNNGRHYQAAGNNRSAFELIAELGSESNAHGLAKIVMSQDTKRKVIWALLVIVGFTAATLQLSLLVRKYLEFQVVELSEIKDSMPVEYPSVTICNIEPISLGKIRRSYMNRESENLKNWLEFVHGFRFKQQSFMNSIRAFYENLGEDAKKISHNLEDLLIWCRFNREPCTAGNFTTFFDGNYFNCFTFNGRLLRDQLQMHGTGPENGLSLIVSIEKDDPLLGTYGVYNFDNNILHSAGIRVVVHAPGSMPSPVDHGFDIPPGYSSSVGLKAIINTRLSTPYGNCTKDSLRGIQTYSNTYFACLQLCKQRLIIEKCKCKSSALPDLPDYNVTFCGVIPDWKAISRNDSGTWKRYDFIPLPNLACEEQAQKDFNNNRSYEADCGCYQPCSETSFLKSVSLSYYPLEFYQLSALEHFFKQKQNKEETHFLEVAYRILKKLAEPQQSKIARNDSRLNDLLTDSEGLFSNVKEMTKKASDLIRQNLLRLNIYLEDLTVVEYKQLPAYGLADLFADIGGTLGLWMGISVLTIMELVELIIRLVGLMFNAEKEAPGIPGSNSNHSNNSQLQPLANGDVGDHHNNHHANNVFDSANFDDLAPSDFDFRRRGGGVESPV